MSRVEKLDLTFLYNKTETFLVSVTHLILRFAIVQNKFQQTNKTEINHIIDNHIKFGVSLHFWWVWPTLWRAACSAACGRACGGACGVRRKSCDEISFLHYGWWQNSD